MFTKHKKEAETVESMNNQTDISGVTDVKGRSNDETAAALGLKITYKDIRTGEIHEIDWTHENFIKIMDDKNVALVFR